MEPIIQLCGQRGVLVNLGVAKGIFKVRGRGVDITTLPYAVILLISHAVEINHIFIELFFRLLLFVLNKAAQGVNDGRGTSQPPARAHAALVSFFMVVSPAEPIVVILTPVLMAAPPTLPTAAPDTTAALLTLLIAPVCTAAEVVAALLISA